MVKTQQVKLMTHYLIEYRFQGKVKSEIKQMIFNLDEKFHLGFAKSKKIPHISFAGPLATNDEARLIKDFTSLCKNTPFCSFKVGGFGFFEKKDPKSETNVVYINIIPSEKLEIFRWTLSQTIMKYCTSKDFDSKKDFTFHATLAMKLNKPEFLKIKKFIEQQNSPKYKHYLIRATIIKNSLILCEYDFLQRRMLTREEALNKNQLTITMKLLNDFFEGKYDPDEKLKLPSPKSTTVKSKPVKSIPVKSIPVKSIPVKSKPVKSIPVKSKPVKSKPVKSTPVKSTPVKSTPVKSKPVKSTPIKSKPVKSKPVKSKHRKSSLIEKIKKVVKKVIG